MEQILYGVGVLLAGLFGTNEFQRFRRHRNGQGGADRIVKAISDEGRETRRVLREQNEAANRVLAGMSKSCEVSHAVLLGKLDK